MRGMNAFSSKQRRDIMDESKVKDKRKKKKERRKKKKKSLTHGIAISLNCNVFQVHGQECYFQRDHLLCFSLYTAFSCIVLSLI